MAKHPIIPVLVGFREFWKVLDRYQDIRKEEETIGNTKLVCYYDIKTLVGYKILSKINTAQYWLNPDKRF